MCLKHEQFQKWFSAKENTKDVLAVIMDEGHCISQWGGDFQPTYSQLEQLHAFVPSHIPILLTSATFPPCALADTCDWLHVSLDKAFFLNLGNHHANIAPSIVHMESSRDHKAIHKILPNPDEIMTVEDYYFYEHGQFNTGGRVWRVFRITGRVLCSTSLIIFKDICPVVVHLNIKDIV